MGTTNEPMPATEFEPWPCPKCGATTEVQAETVCRPLQDITGEYVCPGEFQNGVSVRQTAASIVARDAWFERYMGRAEQGVTP